MTYEKILKDLQNKVYKPIYFFMGDEGFYIDKLTEYIGQTILTEEEKQLNKIIVYGKDTNMYDIISLCQKFPMMSQYQIIIVKEAQNIEDIKNLVYYLKSPSHSSILVINYRNRSLDKRKKTNNELLQLIQEKGVLFESKKIYENKIPGWIANYVKTMEYKIEPKASILLAECLGNDLSKIVRELDKVIITLPQTNATITSEHIEKHVGISKDFNTFELQKALGKKEVFKANQIIKFFSENEKKHPSTLIIASLYSFFSKLLAFYSIQDRRNKKNVANILKVSPFFINDYYEASNKFSLKKIAEIISYLREYDMKSKGLGGGTITYEDILKEMIFKILH